MTWKFNPFIGSFNYYEPAENVVKFNATILANNISVTVTHNLGRIVKVNGIFGTDQINPASDFAILNEGINSFDVAFKSGLSQITDTSVGGTYI